MRKLIKAGLALLILFAVTLGFTSCDRKYNRDEVVAAAKSLIPASAVLNEIYYGKGIGYLENSENNVGIYCEADPAELEIYGFKTLDELKNMTKEVFSKAHSDRMFKGTFSGQFTQSGASVKARYYQKYKEGGPPDYSLVPEYIMVCSESNSLIKGEVSYDLESIDVSGVKGQVVYVTVEIIITYEEKTQNTTLEIGLFEEEDGWRLDTPSYASYNEYRDIYYELQKG